MQSFNFKGINEFVFSHYDFTGKLYNIYFVKDGKIHQPVINLFDIRYPEKKMKCFKIPIQLYFSEYHTLQFLAFTFEDIKDTTIVLEIDEQVNSKKKMEGIITRITDPVFSNTCNLVLNETFKLMNVSD